MIRHRALSASGIAIMAIAAIALAWHFHQTGRGPAFIEPPIAIERTSREIVPVYGLLEADLRVEANFENPFDPEEVNVTAVFTSPSGQVMGTPAFYYQDFYRTLAGNDERLSSFGDPTWKVRFARTEIGEYTVYPSLEDEGRVVTSDTAAFGVSPSESRGSSGQALEITDISSLTIAAPSFS